jgi:hypothetical protein
MGYEYKIIANFTEKQALEIHHILEQHPQFDKKYDFNEEENLEFRHLENKDQMPNLTVIFKPDGIYLCEYSCSYLWQGLQDLKNYLEKENIKYTIFDYQE